MNLALPTVVLFILCIPGFLYSILTRFDYKRGSLIFQEFTGRSFIEKIFIAIVPALIFHCIAIQLVQYWGFNVDARALGTLLTGSNIVTEVPYSYQKLIEDFPELIQYGLLTCIISVIFASINRLGVIFLGLDVKYPFFRYNNPLYYTFLGVDVEKQFDFVVIDAIVSIGNKIFIYSGILTEWKYDGEGKLDTIHLTTSFRRFVGDSSKSQSLEVPGDEVRSIPGEEIVLKCSGIVNYNFIYMTRDELEGWRNRLSRADVPLVDL